MKGKEDKVAVVVGTVTDDNRLLEVPALKVAATKFTKTARARILKVRRVQQVVIVITVVLLPSDQAQAIPVSQPYHCLPGMGNDTDGVFCCFVIRLVVRC